MNMVVNAFNSSTQEQRSMGIVTARSAKTSHETLSQKIRRIYYSVAYFSWGRHLIHACLNAQYWEPKKNIVLIH